MKNPTESPVVESTLQSLICSEAHNRISAKKLSKLLQDACHFTGFKQRKVLFDVFQTRGGKKLEFQSFREGLISLVLL